MCYHVNSYLYRTPCSGRYLTYHICWWNVQLQPYIGRVQGDRFQSSPLTQHDRDKTYDNREQLLWWPEIYTGCKLMRCCSAYQLKLVGSDRPFQNVAQRWPSKTSILSTDSSNTSSSNITLSSRKQFPSYYASFRRPRMIYTNCIHVVTVCKKNTTHKFDSIGMITVVDKSDVSLSLGFRSSDTLWASFKSFGWHNIVPGFR